VGLERLQSGGAISFVERAQPTSLVPNRDTGLQIGGDSANGVFSYQAGVFNGVVDGGSGETDNTDEKDYIGRVFVHPFKLAASDRINGLGLGVAGSVGDQIGTAASSQLPTYRTNSQLTFFTYRANDTFANGKRTRVVPQGYWYVGSLGLLSEYALSSQEVTRATTTTTNATIDNRAWQVALTWVVTGERASFNGVKPRKAFDPKNGGWGALELAARYSELKVDDEAFPRYASITASASRVKGYTGGFNWYLNDNVKVVSNFEYTKFTGGATTGDRAPERAVFSRFQFTF
jgi:phosphate-selective porin OprO/OprP